MMIESLEEYLDTLAGYIYDDDKLVTYKWLSKELEVHVNTAKQILLEFVQRRREKSVECTFLLMGTLHDGGLRVEVVKETGLTEAKKKFKNVISEHIYSLQKALPDIELLAISGEGDPRFSAIKCSESIERTDEEMHALRWGAFSKEVQAQQNDIEKTKSISDSVSVGATNSEIKSEKNNAETKQNTSAQKKGFNNLFAKSNSKKSPPSALQKTADTSSKGKSPKRKTQKGGLDNFFGQGKSQEASPKSLTDQSKTESTKSPTGQDEIESTKPAADQDRTDSTTTKETKKNTLESLENDKKRKKEIRGKKRYRSKDTKPASKRMKRVTIQTDSSASESSNEEDENMREPTPSPEHHLPVKTRSPSPPRVRVEGGKRKVLKVVDKTYEEDGFLVTKKVHEYVSCSEEEPEPEVTEPKKTATRESRPEPKGKKSTKQTSLMNFFKKS